MSYHTSIRRKIAIASWSSPKEGNIYGKMTIDVTKALTYLNYLKEKFNEKVSITHLVGKAAALAFKESPDINGCIFLGRYYPHKTVDLSFLVALDEGKELGKFKICQMDEKSTIEIAQELKKGALRLRNGKDDSYEKPKKMIRHLPTFLLRWFLWLVGFVTSSAGISIKALNLEKYPFGTCIITSVGMFGVDEGYAPPTPFARVPVYLAIPKIKKKPVVVDDNIVIRDILELTATIDHRFVDGKRGAMLANMIRANLENPWVMDGYSKEPWL